MNHDLSNESGINYLSVSLSLPNLNRRRGNLSATNEVSMGFTDRTTSRNEKISLHDLPDTAQGKAAVGSLAAQGLEKITITKDNIDRYMPVLESAYRDSYEKLFTDPTEREPFERWVSDIREGLNIDNVRVITLFGRNFSEGKPEVTSVAASELYRLDDGSMCMFPNYYFSTERAQREEVHSKDARSDINPPIPVMFLSQLSDARDIAESDGRKISSMFFEAEDPAKTAAAGVEGGDQRMIMARNRLYEAMLKGLNVPHFKIPDYVQHPLEEGAEPCKVLTGRFVGSASQARSFIDQFQTAFTGKGLDANSAAEPETYGPMKEGLEQMIAQGQHAQPATFDPSSVDLSRIMGKGR